MKTAFLRSAPLLLAAALAACASGGGKERPAAGGFDVPIPPREPARVPRSRSNLSTGRPNRPNSRLRRASAPAEPARWTVCRRRLVGADRPHRPSNRAAARRVAALSAARIVRGLSANGAGVNLRPRHRKPPRSGHHVGLSDGTVFWGAAPSRSPTGRAQRARTASVERLPEPCFGTSPGSRAALSGFDDLIRYQPLRWRQHSHGRHRGQPNRPRNRQGQQFRFLPMVLFPPNRRRGAGGRAQDRELRRRRLSARLAELPRLHVDRPRGMGAGRDPLRGRDPHHQADSAGEQRLVRLFRALYDGAAPRLSPRCGHPP